MLLIAIAVVVVTLWYLLRFTPLVPDQIARTFTENLLHDRGYRLEVTSVRGNPLGDLVLSGARLVAERGRGEDVVHIREVEVRVHPWNLFRGRVDVLRLRLVEPSVRLGSRGVQRDLLRSTAGAPRAPTPQIRIRNLEIERGRLDVVTDSTVVLTVRDIAAHLELRADSREIRFRVEHLEGRDLMRDLELQSASGSIVTSANVWRFEGFRIETPGTRAQIAGSWNSPSRVLELAGDGDPFDLDDLASFVRLPVTGSVAGPFQFRWDGEEIRFSGTWSGTFAQYAMRDVALELEWAPDSLRIRRAEGFLHDQAFATQLDLIDDALVGRARFTNLDLQAVRPHLPQSRIEAMVDFSRRSHEDTLRLRVDTGAARVDAWSFDAMQGWVDLVGNEAQIRNASVKSAHATASMHGELLGDQLALDWDLDASDAADLLAPLGLELHGTMQARGLFHGALDSLSCNASGEFDDALLGNLQVLKGDFDLEARGIGALAHVDADVRGDGLALGPRRFERFSADLGFSDDVLQLRRVEASSGDTLVAVAGTLHSHERDWNRERLPTQQLRLEGALLRVGQQEIWVEEPATLWWRQRAVRVDSLRLVTRGGRMRLDGTLDLARSRVDVRSEIQEFDLGFFARLAALQQRIGGSGTGWVEAHGSLDASQVDARLRIEAGRWNTLEFDSVHVDLTSDAFGAELRGLRVHTREGALQLDGRLAYLPSLRRWVTGRSGSRDPEELGRASIEARLQLDDLRVERFWQALRGGEAPAWSSRVTTHVELQGSVREPEIAGSGSLLDVTVGSNVDVDTLLFEASYANGVLRVPELHVVTPGAHLEADGRLPVRLHLAQGAKLQRDEPVEARLRLARSSFAIVPRFVELLEPPTQDVPIGEIEGRLAISGTLASPRLLGDVRVDGAGFTLANLEEVYRDAYVAGVFEGNTLRLLDLHARTGTEGRVRGGGHVVFEGFRVADYELSLEAERVPVYSVPSMVALIDGQVEVRAVRLRHGDPIPEFRGGLTILEAEVTREFTSGAGGGGLFESTDTPEWLADVSIVAPGRVWVKNNNADAELKGNVQLIRSTSGLDVNGQATVKRGHYSVYLERFEITRGELDFSRNPGWEPALDIEARRGRRGDRIYVHLTGRPSEPRLSFTSDQGGTSAELQEILMADIQNDPANVATTMVEQIFADFEYIDSITIDPAAGRDPDADQNTALLRPYNVSAGWAMSDRLFMTYTRGFNQSDLNQRVAIELDILRGLLLESAWEQRYIPSRQERSDAAQNAFQFDLKFRYEY
ncbi:MAG: translocation/assembly module TamB domain-containing protein [Candidatus Latescibacterota bacterium]|nr:MAG: translocation/assembly module TamB domain-containing protein [Candidatus Latescibacterota bacterium]